MGGDRLIAAQRPEVLFGRPLALDAHRLERRREALEIPVVGRRPGDELPDQRLDLVIEEGLHRFGQVLVAEHLVALRVDRLALLVDDVVELDDALPDVEVEALDPGLGALDRLGDEP